MSPWIQYIYIYSIPPPVQSVDVQVLFDEIEMGKRELVRVQQLEVECCNLVGKQVMERDTAQLKITPEDVDGRTQVEGGVLVMAMSGLQCRHVNVALLVPGRVRGLLGNNKEVQNPPPIPQVCLKMTYVAIIIVCYTW